jgi:hypothetical protein
MRYEVYVDIDLPLGKVVEKFKNSKNYYDWMEGLEKIETVQGEMGEEGAQHYFHFKIGKREMKMLETVKRNNLPESYLISYEVNGVYNEVDSHFEALNDKKTRYTTDNLFRFKGMMKLMALFMKGAFKKQSLSYLNAFKKFVEKDH